MILCRGGLITREHLPISVARPTGERVAIAAPAAAEFTVERVALDAVERELLEKAMAKAREQQVSGREAPRRVARAALFAAAQA